jgi:predicted N-acyltransferase
MERLRVAESLAGVPAAQWNCLVEGAPAGAGNPFVSHEFLSALIDTAARAAASAGSRRSFFSSGRRHRLRACGATPLFLVAFARRTC